jgi:dihydrofolate synthase / folylpolyglutamate synthase
VSRTLSDWLAHIEALNTRRTLQPIPQIRAGRFDNLLPIARTLDLLDWSCPVTTVAGTNGKGSCVALLSAIFCAAGYRVGSFTSPHLLRYNERIQIDQKSVEDILLCEAFAAIEHARKTQRLGYFEFTTLVGFWIFKRANVDVLILEVGLGGRLDPVNMLDADIAIVSSVDLDHTHLLGSTREAIAYEKAGIMRSGKPCIWGDASVPCRVSEYAKALKTPILVQNQDFCATVHTSDADVSNWTWSGDGKQLENLPIPQLTYLPNAACVLQAVDLLQSRVPVSENALHQGLRQVRVPGRFQVIPGVANTILDVAHNPASAQLLAQNMRDRITAARIVIVIAVLSTKDIQGIISPLVDLADYWYLSEFELDKRAPAVDLAKCLESLGVEAYDVFSSVTQAYQVACERAQPNDVILVMGSFHTVAAVMALHEKSRVV